VTRRRQDTLAYIASRIAAVRRPHAVRVAIDGVDAAGKTTLADELAPIIEGLGRPVRRAEARDVQLFGSVEEVRRRYRERYVPGQQLYFRTAQPERWASIVVDNNDPADPEIVASSLVT
jgi:uridine kinase